LFLAGRWPIAAAIGLLFLADRPQSSPIGESVIRSKGNAAGDRDIRAVRVPSSSAHISLLSS